MGGGEEREERKEEGVLGNCERRRGTSRTLQKPSQRG